MGPPVLLTVKVAGADVTFTICEKAMLFVWSADWRLLLAAAPATLVPFCSRESKTDRGKVAEATGDTAPLKDTL